MSNQPKGFNQKDFDAFLLDYMRQLYPDLPGYQKGELLYAPISIATTINTTPEVTSTDNVYLVETNSDQEGFEAQGAVKLTQTDLRQIKPSTRNEVDDLIDDTFDYFSEEEVDEEVVEVVEPENDVFLAISSPELSDLHDQYLRYGPSAGVGINANTQLVLYIDQGQPRPIPNYETLEVMLVERQIGYESIRTITDDEIDLYGLYKEQTPENPYYGALISAEGYSLNKMADRYAEWNLDIRFKSGYRPVLPFVRDPGDYYDENGLNDLGTPYDPLVYDEQSAVEKMREKYEGKMVIYNVTYGTVNDVPNTIVGADINSARIMTYGYWKLPIELETYRAYNEYNEIGVTPPTENWHINWLDGFNKANFLTPFQGQDGGFVSGWNDFPHIAGANTLDVAEYTEYYDSVGGNVFEKEYLQPYEPPGSVQYYSAAVGQQLQAEALEALNELDEQVALQQQLDSLKETLRTDASNLKTTISSAISSINTDFNDYSQVTYMRSRATTLATDLQYFWHGTYDHWKLYKRSFGKDRDKGKSKGFFRLVEEEMKNSHQKDVVFAYTDSLQYFNCAASVDGTTETTGCGLHCRYVTDDDAVNQRFREAADNLMDMVELVFGNMGLSGGMGNMPGMGSAFAQAWADIKEGVKDFFGNIGSFFDDLFASLGRFKLSDFYTDNYYVRSQVSSWKPQQSWGSSLSGTKYFELPSNSDPVYYSSPIYGSYLTPFDESIENLLGSEDFASTSIQLVNELSSLYTDLQDIIDRIDNLGNMINQQEIESLSLDYNRASGDFGAISTSITVDSQVTMNEAFDMIAKRWIAKAHNTVNHIRQYYRGENRKWFIRYSPESKAIVKKYFPNINDNRFSDKEYKFIDMETI
jgi:hypothetical protein